MINFWYDIIVQNVQITFIGINVVKFIIMLINYFAELDGNNSQYKCHTM